MYRIFYTNSQTALIILKVSFYLFRFTSLVELILQLHISETFLFQYYGQTTSNEIIPILFYTKCVFGMKIRG